MMKRLVVATFASAVAMLPLSAPAQADAPKTKVVKVVKVKPGTTLVSHAIDWE